MGKELKRQPRLDVYVDSGGPTLIWVHCQKGSPKCWKNVGIGQTVWGNIIFKSVEIGEGVGTHNGVPGGTEQHEGDIGVDRMRRVGRGHSRKDEAVNINIGHVVCYDMVCAVWIGQQNSSSTTTNGGKNMMEDVLFLRNAITITQKEEYSSNLQDRL
jgi:hypothetical protein